MKLNSNDEDNQSNSNGIFTLEVKIPDQLPQKLGVLDKISAGIDPRNDLILVGPLIKHKHYLFKKNSTHLTLQYLGINGESTINDIALENGKQYLLENGDVLKSGQVVITIGFEEVGLTHSIDEITSDLEAENNEIQTLSNEEVNEDSAVEKKDNKEKKKKVQSLKVKIKIPEKIKPEVKAYSKGLKLIPYKIWGFIFDVCFTYFVLAFIFPISGIETLVKEILYPISQYILSADFFDSLNSNFNILSIIEFYICFHLLMVSSSIFLATTPGAFFIGLHQKRDKANFLEIHFRAYIYSLVNIFLLPLIFFDLPLIGGKTFKELMTFSEREVKRSILASTFRRVVSPFAILFFIISPLILPFPFNASVSEIPSKINKQKDPHAQIIQSHSPYLGIKVKTELPSNFVLMPYFNQQKIGLALHDLKNRRVLIMLEEKRIDAEELLFNMRFSNPAASLSIPDFDITPTELKKRSLEYLKFSPLDIFEEIIAYGPFIANGILFKHDLLSTFAQSDQFLYNAFSANNPFLHLNSSTTDKILLFNSKGATWFNIIYPKKTNLFSIFASFFLDPTTIAPDVRSKNLPLNIYEALEAFDRSNFQTLLTYYSDEAKRISQTNDDYLKQTFQKNIEQTKEALKYTQRKKGLPKKIEKSFDDISLSLNNSPGSL